MYACFRHGILALIQCTRVLFTFGADDPLVYLLKIQKKEIIYCFIRDAHQNEINCESLLSRVLYLMCKCVSIKWIVIRRRICHWIHQNMRLKWIGLILYAAAIRNVVFNIIFNIIIIMLPEIRIFQINYNSIAASMCVKIVWVYVPVLHYTFPCDILENVPSAEYSAMYILRLWYTLRVRL